MIGRWRYWRLKTKLLFLTLFTSALGISLVCISLILVENQNYRKQLESELHVIAGILAEQSAAALLFTTGNNLEALSPASKESAPSGKPAFTALAARFCPLWKAWIGNLAPI